MTTKPLTIIGSYDKRNTSATFTAPDAHKMVKASSLKASKPRKPKSRTLDEILDRALSMKVKVEMSSKQMTLYPPKFNANGEQIGYNYGQYWTTTKAGAWAALDEISLEIVEAMSNLQVVTQATVARELILG